MMAGWESAAQSATLMGERWRTTDIISAKDFAGGIFANLLANPKGEASSPPIDGPMLITIVRGEAHHRQWQGGTLTLDGPLPTGGLIIIPAGQEPRAVVTTDIRVLHVHVPTALLRARRPALTGTEGDVELIDPRLSHDPILSGTLSLLVHALDSREPLNRLWLDSIGDALCLRALERWSNVAGLPRPRQPSITGSDWRLRRAIEYLEARLGEDVALADVAATVDLTTTHLTNLFRAGTGEPPHRWLMRRRLDRACELLGDRRASITEIAHGCGFASAQHFATVFRRQRGMTPTAYRLRHLS